MCRCSCVVNVQVIGCVIVWDTIVVGRDIIILCRRETMVARYLAKEGLGKLGEVILGVEALANAIQGREGAEDKGEGGRELEGKVRRDAEEIFTQLGPPGLALALLRLAVHLVQPLPKKGKDDEKGRGDWWGD